MRIVLLIFLITYVIFTPTAANADCMACSESAGIRVFLKDGNIVDGYIRWSYYALEGLVSKNFAQEVRFYHKDIVDTLSLEKMDWDSWEVIFPIWITLMNRTYEQDIRMQKPEDDLWVFTDLEEINYPFERYVVVEGKTRQLKADEIKSIEANPNLPLRVDTTGIDALPFSDIQRLQTKPLFSVEHEWSVGADVYVVYGTSITLSQILDHILFHSEGGLQQGHDAILLNREYVTNRNTFDLTIHSKESYMIMDSLTAEETALKDFVTKAREIKSTFSKVEGEYSKRVTLLDSELRSLEDKPDDFPRKKELTMLREQERVVYVERRKDILSSYGKSLGDREAMRKLGIIVFSYGWD